MNGQRDARPLGLAAMGRAASTATVTSGHRGQYSTIRPDVALMVVKRGRPCVVAKLVTATPLEELVLAMPYRHRQTVEHVSIPPIVIAYARKAGAQQWLVRLDGRGECFALPLAQVERVGWLKRSDGKPEWFVPLSTFRPIEWQNWDYVKPTVLLGEPDTVAEQQLDFLNEVAS